MQKKLLTAAAAVVLITALAVSFAFAQSDPPDRVRVLRSSNLRAGPGTGFAIIDVAQTGAEFGVQGCNAACTWYQLETGQWIAAFLVEPVSAATVTSTQTLSVTTTPTGTLSTTPITTSVRSTANRNSNLREGPGTNFPIVGRAPAGQVLEVVGRNEAGTWLALSSGEWIAAFLVDDAPPMENLPVVDETTPASTPAPSPTPTVMPTPTTSVCDWDSYPTVCILRYPPDLECADVFYRNFEVRPPDPHNLDEDGNGIGCEDDTAPSPTPIPPTPTRSPTPQPTSTGSPTPQSEASQPPTPQPTPTEAAASSTVCNCSADLYQCADFGTHDEAQACYEYCVAQGAGDIHRINIDNDELACESLR